MVAKVDEQKAAMVANAMYPAGQADGLADVLFAKFSAGVGAILVHGVGIASGLARQGFQVRGNSAWDGVPVKAGRVRVTALERWLGTSVSPSAPTIGRNAMSKFHTGAMSAAAVAALLFGLGIDQARAADTDTQEQTAPQGKQEDGVIKPPPTGDEGIHTEVPNPNAGPRDEIAPPPQLPGSKNAQPK